MRLFILILTLLGLAPLGSLRAQEASPAASPAKTSAEATAKPSDVYHVVFGKAALGKAAELADFLKQPDPKAKEPARSILLRHQNGAEWDYVAIEHVGATATVENPATPMPAAARDLMETHDDTYVAGPPWAEFAKAMGIDGEPSKTAGSVYVVAVHRAAPGHREPLEKMLREPPDGTTDTSAGNVLLTHLEGASWNFLAVTRHDSWEKFAADQVKSVAATNKKQGGWFELRKHVATHNDTLADRIAP